MSNQRFRSRWAAIGAAVAVTLGLGGIGIASATVSSGEKPIFRAIEPCRLVDTRTQPFGVGPRSSPLGPDEVFSILGRGTVGNCDLPGDATALTLNVTGLDATEPTFLTLFPGGGQPPKASHLNPAPGQPPAPNAVSVDLDGAGQFSVFNRFGFVNLIIDVTGMYIDHTHHGELETLIISADTAVVINDFTDTEPEPGRLSGRGCVALGDESGTELYIARLEMVLPVGAQIRYVVVRLYDDNGQSSVESELWYRDWGGGSNRISDGGGTTSTVGRPLYERSQLRIQPGDLVQSAWVSTDRSLFVTATAPEGRPTDDLHFCGVEVTFDRTHEPRQP